MTWGFFGDKPSLKQILAYCVLDLNEKRPRKIIQNEIVSMQANALKMASAE